MIEDAGLLDVLSKWWGVIAGFFGFAVVVGHQHQKITRHEQDIKDIKKGHKEDIDRVFDRLEKITEKHHEMHIAILERVNK